MKVKQAMLLSDADRVMFELTVHCRIFKYIGEVGQLNLPSTVFFEYISRRIQNIVHARRGPGGLGSSTSRRPEGWTMV